VAAGIDRVAVRAASPDHLGTCRGNAPGIGSWYDTFPSGAADKGCYQGSAGTLDVVDDDEPGSLAVAPRPPNPRDNWLEFIGAGAAAGFTNAVGADVYNDVRPRAGLLLRSSVTGDQTRDRYGCTSS
jgi:hypothetical protein